MPQFSLTEFVDIVSKSGTPKATKIRQIKHRPEYSPATDFYRLIREGLIEAHQLGQGLNSVDRVLTGLTDLKKKTAYPPIINGYKKWLGRKSTSWFEPPNEAYTKGNVTILINPELGLEVNGKPHLIKLYFKREPLAKNKVDIITHLMAITALEHCLYPHTTMSVLDVRRSKLFSPTVPIAGLTDILNAELAYIASLWPRI